MVTLIARLSRRAFLRTLTLSGAVATTALLAACGNAPPAPATTVPSGAAQAKPTEAPKPAAAAQPTEAPKPAAPAAAAPATAAPATAAAAQPTAAPKPATTGTPGGKVFIAQEADPINLD